VEKNEWHRNLKTYWFFQKWVASDTEKKIKKLPIYLPGWYEQFLVLTGLLTFSYHLSLLYIFFYFAMAKLYMLE